MARIFCISLNFCWRKWFVFGIVAATSQMREAFQRWDTKNQFVLDLNIFHTQFLALQLTGWDGMGLRRSCNRAAMVLAQYVILCCNGIQIKNKCYWRSRALHTTATIFQTLVSLVYPKNFVIFSHITRCEHFFQFHNFIQISFFFLLSLLCIRFCYSKMLKTK